MIKVYTQIGAVAYAIILGAKRAIELRAFAGRQAGFVTETMLQLVAGASLLRFAVDQNEAQGLGDGISLLICAGIGASKCFAQPDRTVTPLSCLMHCRSLFSPSFRKGTMQISRLHKGQSAVHVLQACVCAGVET